MFALLGIELQYVTYPYDWNDPDYGYPPRLRELAERAPTEYHLANKAFIDGKWALVDATWDPPLGAAGFPVNESWDGISDTKNAVKPLREIVHASAMERAEFTDEVKASRSEEESRALDEFVAAFNAWLKDVRGEDQST